jgi:inner membrane protein
MDPVAHTFTGAALAAAGLRRATPLAGAALLLGANVPDVDALAYFAGGYDAVAFRRGLTHGVLALVVWPFVLAGALLAWDRWVRRRRGSAAAPARAGPLLAVSAIAVATHPTLDWLNNYGLRWLMPFDGRWFYGDALFIVDPWLWLIPGGAAFLMFSRSRSSLLGWATFAILATLLVLGNSALVPALTRALWVVAVALLALLRWRWSAAPVARLERAAHAALALTAVYVVAMLGASAAARGEVRAALAGRGIEAESVMVAPLAGNPFGGSVVVATADDYFTGGFAWFDAPRLTLEPERIARPSGPVFAAAAQTIDARKFLRWSRFPAVEIEPQPDGGTIVRFSDVRYRDAGRLGGPLVRLDAALRPVEASR